MAVLTVATLESRSRADAWRSIRMEAAAKVEAQRAGALAAEARTSLRRADRVRAAVDRLQPFVTRIESHLRMELGEATRQGDHNRRLRIELEIDELFALANEAAQEAGR
jgi:hypothetical protein